MKKSLIAKLALALLLIITYFLLGDKKTEKVKTEDQLLLTDTNFNQIKIEGEEFHLQFKKVGEDWQIEGENLNLNQKHIAELVYNLSNLVIEQTLEEANPTDFGFENPTFTLVLTTPMGRQTLYLGNASPNQKSIYAQLQDDPSLYVLSLDQIEHLVRSPVFYLDGNILHLNFKDLKNLQFVRKQGTLSLEAGLSSYPTSGFGHRYRFVEPYPGFAVDNEALGNLLQNWQQFFSFFKDEMISHPDNLALYGLDKPQATLSFTDNQNRTLTFKVGSLAMQGVSYYAQLEGDDKVFHLNTDLVEEAINLKPFGLLSKFVSLEDINQLNSFSFVEGNQVKTLPATAENSAIYEKFLMIFYDGLRTEPLSLDNPMLYQTIFHFKNGTTRTVSFMSYNEVMLAVSIDQRLTPFLVSRRQLAGYKLAPTP